MIVRFVFTTAELAPVEVGLKPTRKVAAERIVFWLKFRQSRRLGRTIDAWNL